MVRLKVGRAGVERPEARAYVAGRLGVDDTTTRMARFLADGGIDISLLTFHGYTYEGKTLLARQVQVGADTGPVKPPRESREQFDNRIQERAKRWPDAQELWDATLDMLRDNFHNAPEITSTSRADWGNHRVNFQLRGPRGRRNSAAIVIHPRIDLLQVIFFRNSISLRLEEFTQLQSAIPSQTSPANSPVEKEGVTEIRFQLNPSRSGKTTKTS